MKKVALISDGWKRLITYAWVAGIMDKIAETGRDICLYHYNCYGNWSQDKKYNNGEYNIYNLPDLEEFDGIILDCTNIEDQEQLEKIISRLKKVSVPVVSIVYIVDGFYYAGIDNTSTIMELMEHLYHVHGCRSFLFAGGPEGNSENTMRMQAFRKSLQKFGIPEEKDMFLFGDYDYATGVRYMTELFEQKRVLPDAIVCANDNIAAGICATAEKFGLRIPEDFCVTGFDNLEKAAYFCPQITTAAINREEIASRAIEILMDLWDGKEVETLNFVPSQCIMGESCGCPNSGLVDYRDYTKNQIIYGVKRQYDEEQLMGLESRMANCNDFESIFQEIADYFAGLQCDGFYIVVDRMLFCPGLETDFPEEGYRMENLVVAYAAEKPHAAKEMNSGMEIAGMQKLSIQTLEQLYAHMERNGSQSSYMFTPIHFREKAVGFSVLKNGTFLFDNPYFYDIHNTFVSAMKSLLKRQQMESMYQELKNMYNKDPMTGLYNRIAYTEYIKPEYWKYCERKIPCALVFFDVDYFKEINDIWGHEYGDRLLKKIAEILQEQCPKDGYAYRFGGDEFIVFFPNANQENAEVFLGHVETEIQKLNIGISSGIIITDPDSGKDLDEYVSIADHRMYEIKRRRHQTDAAQ